SPGATPPQRGSGCGGGRAARVDIVDQAHTRRRGARGDERTGDVCAPLLQRQPSLALDRARSPDEPLHRQLPETAELVRERLGRPVPSLERASGVGRDEGEHCDVRPTERLDDESRSLTRKPSLTTFLPRL